MIGSAVKLLRDELAAYVIPNKRAGDTITDADIKLENIAGLENDSNNIFANALILSLVNIEEESTLKNTSHFQRTMGRVQYVEPPIFLNLYILITATLGQNQQDAYEFALHRLSLVIRFFQGKRCFTIKNSPFSSVANDNALSTEEKEELRMTIELYTLTFEQINHLWGSLGSKQVPFVMYKIRLVEIKDTDSREAPVIEEINNDLNPVTNN